jgi:hypothetical protein
MPDPGEGLDMTTELQRAMARYEEARIRYKKSVLASLHGAANGDAIREAIAAFQAASGDLKRLTPAEPGPPAEAASEDGSSPGWAFVRKLLKVG